MVAKSKTMMQIQTLYQSFLKQVRERDHEIAHMKEDEIWFMALTAIANGEFNAKEIAQAALKTRNHKYDKWYA